MNAEGKKGVRAIWQSDASLENVWSYRRERREKGISHKGLKISRLACVRWEVKVMRPLIKRNY
jgi:hypothetical protein